MADLNLSSKDAGQGSKAAKRSSNDAFPQAEPDVSVSISNRLAEASNPTCGCKLASCRRACGRPDPRGGIGSRKMSGWMVPKTEIPEPGDPVSTGPAWVPADLRTNVKNIAAIPNG